MLCSVVPRLAGARAAGRFAGSGVAGALGAAGLCGGVKAGAGAATCHAAVTRVRQLPTDAEMCPAHRIGQGDIKLIRTHFWQEAHLWRLCLDWDFLLWHILSRCFCRLSSLGRAAACSRLNGTQLAERHLANLLQPQPCFQMYIILLMLV